MAIDSGIQTNQIFTNNDEVCISHLSCILLAVFTQNAGEAKRSEKSDWKKYGAKKGFP